MWCQRGCQPENIRAELGFVMCRRGASPVTLCNKRSFYPQDESLKHVKGRSLQTFLLWRPPNKRPAPPSPVASLSPRPHALRRSGRIGFRECQKHWKLSFREDLSLLKNSFVPLSVPHFGPESPGFRAFEPGSGSTVGPVATFSTASRDFSAAR